MGFIIGQLVKIAETCEDDNEKTKEMIEKYGGDTAIVDGKLDDGYYKLSCSYEYDWPESILESYEPVFSVGDRVLIDCDMHADKTKQKFNGQYAFINAIRRNMEFDLSIEWVYILNQDDEKSNMKLEEIKWYEQELILACKNANKSDKNILFSNMMLSMDGD